MPTWWFKSIRAHQFASMVLVITKGQKMTKTKPKSFSRLSAAEKRVAIAGDIIKQIKAERYHIQTGTWLSVESVELVNPTTKENQAQTKAKLVQSILLGGKHTIVIDIPAPTCICCAVGAACASAIRLFNQDTLPGSPEDGYELESYDNGMEILRKYFSRSQVDLMEAAFEMRSDGDLHESASNDKLEDAVEFGERESDDEDRLIAICKNIIKNNGTFKP